MEIPFGICQCGRCGLPTRIPTKSNAFHGDVRGVPRKFLRGHSTHKRAGGRKYSPEEAIAAFWAKVDRRGPKECWPFIGAISSGGYGNVQFEGKVQGSNIVAWTIAHGPVPKHPDPKQTNCVLHRCDHRPCCNEAHLFIGTKDENAKDMAKKGRHARHRLGAQKFTPETAVEAFNLVMSGHGKREVAKQFGVSHKTVQALSSGAIWSRFTDAER